MWCVKTAMDFTFWGNTMYENEIFTTGCNEIACEIVGAFGEYLFCDDGHDTGLDLDMYMYIIQEEGR